MLNKRRGGYVLSLEVINGMNLAIPSNRTPAGLYVLVSTPYGQCSTAIKAAMADCSVSWDETLIIRGRPLIFPQWLMPIFSRKSKAVHLEIRASFECGPMLGRGELVGTFKTTLEQLLAHDGQSELSLPVVNNQRLSKTSTALRMIELQAVNNQRPSLKLKARRIKTPKLVDYAAGDTRQSEIGRSTDIARDAYTLFWKSNLRSDLDSAIDGFQTVLDKCPLGHPDRAAALSNLAHAILCGFTKNILTDVDRAIFLFRSALALRPPEHPDHLLSILDLCQALQQRYSHKKRHADLCKAAELYRILLPLCVEGSYLHRVVCDTNGVVYVIEQCNALPRDPSDESISLRRIVLDLCPPQHELRTHSLNRLAGDLYARFEGRGNINHIYEAVHLSREALAICPDDGQFSFLLSVLSSTLALRFNHHGDPFDLYESISLDVVHRETLDSRSIASSHHSGAISQAAHAQARLTGIPGYERRQSPSPLPPQASSSNHETRPRERNVVIFGESGSGKSSVINAIMQKELAKTSSDAAGCTFSYQRHRVEISGQRFVLFDTAGLNEGTVGTVPAAKAEEKLKGLLRELMSPGSDGIGLLVYCIRSTRARRALIRNFNIFYSAICRKKVPIVLVVTGLENEVVMENWWDTNGKEFKNRGMHFEDHACVTTLRQHPGIPDVFSRRIAESSDALRKLIVNNCSEWAVDESWFKQSFADVRNMISDSWNGEKPSPSTLIICDSSLEEELEIAPSIYGVVRTCLTRISGETYQVHRVPQPSASGVEEKLEGDLLIYYARVDDHSTARQKFRAFYTAYRGNMLPVVVVVKGLNDRKSAHQWVEQYIMHDGIGRLFSAFSPARDLRNDSVMRQVEQELQDLIRQSCLIRSEEKGGGRYKSFARFVGRRRL
ncbi:hypothetical protein DFH29DRAFT_1003513 [Suillus ampliporus]|nr:hypothetical protein DFH29DRAFT_1003513 [Suillus ampliporus]